MFKSNNLDDLTNSEHFWKKACEPTAWSSTVGRVRSRLSAALYIYKPRTSPHTIGANRWSRFQSCHFIALWFPGSCASLDWTHYISDVWALGTWAAISSNEALIIICDNDRGVWFARNDRCDRMCKWTRIYMLDEFINNECDIYFVSSSRVIQQKITYIGIKPIPAINQRKTAKATNLF